MLRLPDELLAHTGAVGSVEQPAQGLSFEVYFLAAERGRFVLKIGARPDTIAELADEARVLRRLRDKVPFVAQPVGQTIADGRGLFLFTHVEGESLLDALAREDAIGRHRLIVRAAETLRAIHGWTPDLPRPADWLGDALGRAARNLATGAVPNPIPARYDFAGADPRELLDELLARRAAVQPDIVFGHGDPCLPNLLARDGAIAGLVDWSRGGYADRRYDLVTALWSIGHNLRDVAYQQTFLRAFGYAGPRESLRYFQKLSVLL